MKVLVFAKHPSGGIKTYISYVYGNAVMQDIEFVLVTPATGNGRYFRDRLGQSLVYAETGSSNRSLIKALWKYSRTHRPDIIHSHGFTAGALAALPAWLLGIRHIITTHDVFDATQFKGLSGALKKYFIGFCFNLAACINPVGEDASNNFLTYFPRLGRKGRVKPIRNGIDVGAFLSSGRRNIRAEVGLRDEVLLAGFFGRFMAQKGFRYLVDLVEQWNHTGQARPLHVACFGWGGFIREEQEALRHRKLDQYFHFFDNTDDMPAALRGVDVVTMPSRWEACPLLAMEAMTAGVPLIASDCIGNAEVVRGTPALTFAAESVDAFKAALVNFVDNEEQVKRGAADFREQAAVQFDVNSTARKLHDLYVAMPLKK